MKTKIIFILFFFLNILVCKSQDNKVFISDLSNKNYLDFKFAEVDYSKDFINCDSSSAEFKIYDFKAIKKNNANLKTMLVFESKFYLKNYLKTEKAAIAVGALDYPAAIFLNGKNIASFGIVENSYISKTQYSTSVELFDYDLNYGDSVNTLTIQIYPGKKIKPALFRYFISTEHNVEKWAFWRNFIRIDIVKGASIFSIILFLYFILSFIQNKYKKDKRYLIFAFLCIAFILSYINISISYNSVNELLIYKIARASSPLLTYLVVLFTFKNTGFLDKKYIKIGLLIPIIIFTVILSLQPDIEKLEQSFALYAIFVNFPYFLIIFVLSALSAFKTFKRNKIVYFTGLLIVVISIVSDTINFTSYINPYAWLIPIGFFSFLIAIFFILSSEQTNIYHLAIERQTELQKMKDNLELLVVERTKQIENQKNEISEKNNTLEQQKEEILTQIRNLEILNLELEINNKIIENQKQEIRKKLSDSIAKSVELKNENIKSQLKAIANQMNPHFIFNTLNAIKYFVLQNDIKTADTYLEKFAKLMRCTLYNSISETIPLKDEVTTLTLYLELEKFRANNKFDFNILIDDEAILDYYKIPSLLIQPFVENSIIHGIKTLEKNGLITVEFKTIEENLICTIEDNGIGRLKSEEMKKQIKTDHKSVGTTLISERLKLMSELYKGSYSFEYIDLASLSEGKTGTKVILKLPIIE